MIACSIRCNNQTLEETMKIADGAILGELNWTIPLSFFGNSYLYNVKTSRTWRKKFPKSYWWKVNLGASCDKTFTTKGKFIGFIWGDRLGVGHCDMILPATDQLIQKLDQIMGRN